MKRFIFLLLPLCATGQVFAQGVFSDNACHLEPSALNSLASVGKCNSSKSKQSVGITGVFSLFKQDFPHTDLLPRKVVCFATDDGPSVKDAGDLDYYGQGVVQGGRVVWSLESSHKTTSLTNYISQHRGQQAVVNYNWGFQNHKQYACEMFPQ